jgi:hypothetical protein
MWRKSMRDMRETFSTKMSKPSMPEFLRGGDGKSCFGRLKITEERVELAAATGAKKNVPCF